MNIVELKKHARVFRGALDRLDWSSMPTNFRQFPAGTCEDISDILAEYLYKKDLMTSNTLAALLITSNPTLG